MQRALILLNPYGREAGQRKLKNRQKMHFLCFQAIFELFVIFNPNQEKNLLGYKVVDNSNYLNSVAYCNLQSFLMSSKLKRAQQKYVISTKISPKKLFK